MDSHAFDRLVRGFDRAASRRRAFAGLLGGALAAAGGEAAARRRRHHVAAMASDDPRPACAPPCARGTICCQNVCQPPAVLERGCPTGSDGFLTMPNGRLRCAAAGHPACACLGAYRDCAPGTRCQMRHGSVICAPAD